MSKSHLFLFRRVIKTEHEIDLLRYVSKITSEAHKQGMLLCKPGNYEYQIESELKHYSYSKGGSRHLAFLSIVASGPNAAVLHYGHAGAPNNRQIQDGDLCLMDMGAEYFCYGSDVAVTVPANGKFSEKQKFVYETVLKANRAVIKASKPGVKWANMHRLAERTILEEFKKKGLVTGSVEKMMEVDLGAVFLPHGMGHLLGMDVHDVGGYPYGTERINRPGIKYLRTTRNLKAGMYITVEPGVYFIDHVLDKALTNTSQSKFLRKSEIDKYRGFGGVRIEEDVLVTSTGMEIITDVPRTVDQIEQFLASSAQDKNVLYYSLPEVYNMCVTKLGEEISTPRRKATSGILTGFFIVVWFQLNWRQDYL